jgi:two-component system LytT family sensor kinase
LAIQEKRLIEQQKSAEIEKEKINIELNYLRLQINPHFLFNTLSFIYTEVIKYSEAASNGVMLLSKILRNILAEPDPQGKIALKEEVGHMVDLIELHQLRFNQKLAIDLIIKELDQSSGKKMIPFILITFLENAFKHGDLQDKKNPAVINLTVVDNYLYFSLHNKKKINQFKTESLGIGIKNIKKRLYLAYPDNHTFEIKNETNFYSVNLKIPLTYDKLRNN